MTLEQKLEAILFYKAEPLEIAKLAKILEVKEDEVISASEALAVSLENRGVSLIRLDKNLALGTTPAGSELIESLIKDELAKDIGKAGLETLTIVLYRGPISRPEIDYIRGVNSSFVLRNLLIRGLVTKEPSSTDARTFVYQPTIELLATLGLTQISDLPDYNKIQTDIANFVAEKSKLTDQ